MRQEQWVKSPKAVFRVVSIWLLRVGVLTVILHATHHPPLHVTTGPLQSVETQHPITCVHTRLTDEVEEWKIQRSLQMVRELGATTIIEFFPWSYIEEEEDQYRWGHFDRVVKHARAQGLTVIARVGMVPAWAQPEGDSPDANLTMNLLTPEHYADFARFVEEFTRHYKGQVDHIIIWNEPNLTFEWGFQPVEPENYINLLKLATPAARRGNPDVIVLAGALAPTLEPVGSQYGMNDLDYLSRLYGLGFKDYFDVLAAHTYGLKFPPEEPPASDVLNFRRIELLRQIMLDNNDGDKPIIITESGWNDHPRWTKAVSPGQRIVYTIDGFEYAEENWPWVENLCLWAFRYPRPVNSYPDYFTLVTPDFAAKPIYHELQAWARGWER
ncbi:MAG: beta-galactosidase [Anaerolineae bacterium]|nr:beta-galactosidase [Anaerolineae bacterium]